MLVCLTSVIWLQTAWSDTGVYEECIKEPVFEGKVCTLQLNRDADVGLILIHGLGGSIEDWETTIAALGADFHVLAFDLPGFGKSDKGSQTYSPTRYAKLADHLAAHYFHGKPYHIVGHSMGGAIALRFASLRPAHFQRLVLLDAAGILHPQVLSKFQAGSMLQEASGMKQTRGFAERFSGKIMEQIDRLPISPIDIANSKMGREYVLQGDPQMIAALELAGEDFSDAIVSVTEETLILWGDGDPTVPRRTGEVLAAHMPHARLEIVFDSGHVPMQDQSKKTNELIRRHLSASDQELSRLNPLSRRQPALASKRVGTCSGESGKVFQGDYLSIDVRDCTNVIIRDARMGRLKVVDSRISLIDTDISGKVGGVQAFGSNVTITNGSISGVIAIEAEKSRFDLAGVSLKGSEHAVKAKGSKFVFSICHVRSPHMDGALHAYKKMNDAVL
ncbi:hypothetical protein TK5_14110 [Sideroxyarcus sp. TK5]